jgi:hypothetical protein
MAADSGDGDDDWAKSRPAVPDIYIDFRPIYNHLAGQHAFDRDSALLRCWLHSPA